MNNCEKIKNVLDFPRNKTNFMVNGCSKKGIL